MFHVEQCSSLKIVPRGTRVCKQADLGVVIDHFNHYPLQTKKQKVFEIWREMVFERNRSTLNCSSEKFNIFAAKMSRLNQKSRAFQRRVKYG